VTEISDEERALLRLAAETTRSSVLQGLAEGQLDEGGELATQLMASIALLLFLLSEEPTLSVGVKEAALLTAREITH
jgi:hypothetical protein